MALHEIVRRYPGQNIGVGIFDAEASRGLALAFSAEGVLSAASGTFTGFLTRDVVSGGPGLEDVIYPGRLELPFTQGEEVSVEKADAVEAEGSPLNADGFVLTSGTGSLSSGSSVGTLLSFIDGKFYEAQSGDVAYYVLAAVLTPETVGNVRIRAEAIR